MELLALWLLSTILTQLVKRSGLGSKTIAFTVSLVLATGYFFIQIYVDEATLQELVLYTVSIWWTATIIYDYVLKNVITKQ